MKILELTNFSAGICGVWQRVKQESIELSKRGHKVLVLSSNAVKGSNETASSEEKIGKIEIKRFPFKKLGGESFMSWSFEPRALEFKPDIIIAHSYRHIHTTKALKIAKKLKEQGKKCHVFLVTHAPFVDKEVRGFVNSLIINIYDTFIGKRTINKFDKIIVITKWEIPFIKKLGVKEKISYIPNGIPQEFFQQKIKETKKGRGILFLGRISPIKDIETLIKAVRNLNIKVSITGPAETEYKNKLLSLIEKEKIKNVKFHPAIYDLKNKIELIDKHEIFVLPSLTESMPQSLIEAMARGKICISSATRGGKEMISDKKNGFLFEIGNEKQLTQILKNILKLSDKEKNKINKEAIKTAKKFRWENLIKKLENLF